MNDYKESSYRSSVMQIQSYLLNISRIDPDIPRVNPDGIYGESTRDAVYLFQSKYMSHPTGKVDYDTWQMLLRKSISAEELLASPFSAALFDLPLKNGVLKKGDASDTVHISKIILRALGKGIPIAEKLSDGNVFDDDTENAVMALQKVFGIDESGQIDKLTWNRMVAAYKNSLSYE